MEVAIASKPEESDPIELELIRSTLFSITEEMGAALERSAFSPNIKERRDDSSAIFDSRGQMVAMGDDLPVHLGAIQASVQAFVDALPLEPGDVGLLNDPFSGGSHLPDLTMVQGVWKGERLLFYVANRAHHSDIGGMSPGSMGPSTEIYQEGLVIPPIRLVRRGELDKELLRLVLANVRTPKMRRGDLTAQLAACHLGERRLLEAYAVYGERLLALSGALLLSTERRVRDLVASLPDGHYSFEDRLDPLEDGQEARLSLELRIDGDRAVTDFSGSSPQVTSGAVNCPLAVTASAVYYCFRCLMDDPVPFNGGFGRAIEIVAPKGSILNAKRPAAVAAGNVETSQRVVDVVFGALAQVVPDRVPAATQGTMNNLSFGGLRPDKTPFAYYETMGGGTGAWAGGDGESGIQSHMTNTLNTPIEALENELPVRIRAYSLREGSGGAGQKRGGEGLIRELEMLQPVVLSILSERRRTGPYGLAGGKAGKPGRNLLIRGGAEVLELGPRVGLRLEQGDIIRMETPGGGGFGACPAPGVTDGDGGENGE